MPIIINNAIINCIPYFINRNLKNIFSRIAGLRIERLVKRVTVKELEHKLDVARKENRAQIKACGEKHNFKPFEQCKNCYKNCRGMLYSNVI